MNDIEHLVEAAQEVMATRDIFVDEQLLKLTEAKTAVEAMLKRAKVFEGNIKAPNHVGYAYGFRQFIEQFPRGENFHIIVIPIPEEKTND